MLPPLHRPPAAALKSGSSSFHPGAPSSVRRVSWSGTDSVTLLDAGTRTDEVGWAHATSSWEWERDGDAFLIQGRQRYYNYRPKRTTRTKRKAAAKQSMIRVISFPWTDERGVRGLYTGEVDPFMRPHGRGAFSADEGGGLTEKFPPIEDWEDGLPVAAENLNAREIEDGIGYLDTRDYFHNPEKVPSVGVRQLIAGSIAVDEGRVAVSPLGSGRSSPVSFATLPPTPSSPTCPAAAFARCVNSTSLPGYRLGEPARRRSHMRVPPRGADPGAAVADADSLRPLDFAFVLRTDGTWAYGIVADRPIVRGAPSIRFVLDERGSTKTIRKKNWGLAIRRVNVARGEAVGNEDSDGSPSEAEPGIVRDVAQRCFDAEHISAGGRGAPHKRRKRMAKKLERRGSAGSFPEDGTATSDASGSTDGAVVAPAGGPDEGAGDHGPKHDRGGLAPDQRWLFDFLVGGVDGRPKGTSKRGETTGKGGQGRDGPVGDPSSLGAMLRTLERMAQRYEGLDVRMHLLL